MNQGTNAWLEWRKSGIGSSDAPIIMGVGYRTPYQLYLEKIGQAPLVEDPNKKWIFEKGHKTEREARALLEIEHGGVEFTAGLVQMIDYPYLRASLDGANLEIREGKEFKLVSLKEFNEGKCPARYFPQIQHQYMVTNLKKIDIVLCCYVGRLKTLKIKEVEVPIDMDYILNKLLPAELEFWWRVQNKIPPKLEKGDAVKIKDKTLIAKIKKQDAIQKKAEKLNKQILSLKHEYLLIDQEILSMIDQPLMIYQKKMYRKIQTVRVEAC
jgi:putative phage-type endonuclease